MTMKWQPMETAPDMCLVLSRRGIIFDATRDRLGRWLTPSSINFTVSNFINEELIGWMPIPELPEKED